MFVIVLNYVKPIEDVERHLEEHRSFLKTYYDAGIFHMSGPLVPRTGGLILCGGNSRAEIEVIIADDPFHREGIAAHQILEFIPRMASDACRKLMAEGGSPASGANDIPRLPPLPIPPKNAT